jgi:hypothetical protein
MKLTRDDAGGEPSRRGTGVPPVGPAGVPPVESMTGHSLNAAISGRDARWPHGRDARATIPPAAATAPFRLTIIHPCIGRRRGERDYVRTWQMEPLPAATLAGLTPPDVLTRFYDDRMETIPFDEPTDLVAMSVETYTARRAYQIATEYRRRGVPVVMGGFHPSLCPDEVAQYAEAVVTGEAEELWPRVLDDARHGRLEKFYRSTGRTNLTGLRPDRSIFRGKRYLPIGLVEAGRGCHFKCDFCAVQTVFKQSQTRRPPDEIISELAALKRTKKLFFFDDDNITSNLAQAKEFFRALIPLGIRWVGQSSINAAHDEEFLELPLREFLLVRENGVLLACGALWDQRAFRQTVIRGYSRRLSAARPWINAASRLLGTPRLPPVDAPLAHALLSPLAVGRNANLPELVAAFLPPAAARGLDFVTLALPASDPRLPPLRRRFTTQTWRSRLYRVDFPDQPDHAMLDPMLPCQPDLAFL